MGLWFSTHWARPHTCGVACESHSFVWLWRSRHWAQHNLKFVERLCGCGAASIGHNIVVFGAVQDCGDRKYWTLDFAVELTKIEAGDNVDQQLQQGLLPSNDQKWSQSLIHKVCRIPSAGNILQKSMLRDILIPLPFT